jgi:hypothetical protein
VLGNEQVFLNTVGSVELLAHVLAAADAFESRPPEKQLAELTSTRGIASLFV